MLPVWSIALANWFTCVPACPSAIARVSLTSLRSYAIIFDPLYDVLSSLHQSFDVTLKSLRITVKKGYLVKLWQDSVQSFSEMFQSHLEIGLVNDIWSYINFSRFAFRSWCAMNVYHLQRKKIFKVGTTPPPPPPPSHV